MCALVGDSTLDIQTVTVGEYVDKFNLIYGYSSSLGVGSISDGTFNPKGGATILSLNYNSSVSQLFFQINGTQTNAGWTTVTIAGTAYTRASATFSTSGGTTSWAWSTGTNPFGTTVGATRTVVFT